MKSDAEITRPGLLSSASPKSSLRFGALLSGILIRTRGTCSRTYDHDDTKTTETVWKARNSYICKDFYGVLKFLGTSSVNER